MKIFISYSSMDKALCENIIGFLEDLDHTVWADQSLKSGQEWWNEILQEIRQAEVFITLLSNNYDSSGACDQELHYATELNKVVLPIKIEALSNELLPYDLGKFQMLDYYLLSESKRITSLVNALSAIANQADYPRNNPQPLPEEPVFPISYKTRIFNRLDIEDELDVDSQKEIVAELRKAIQNNLQDHQEIKILLQKMLKRGDEIRLNISYEIKELLDKIERQEYTKEKQGYTAQAQPISRPEQPATQGKVAIGSDEKLNIGLQFMAFFIPIVGFVMFYIYKNDARAKANRAIILAVSGMVLVLIFGSLGETYENPVQFNAVSYCSMTNVYGYGANINVAVAQDLAIKNCIQNGGISDCCASNVYVSE